MSIAVIWAPLLWIILVIMVWAVRTRRSGSPLIPRAPAEARFVERWTSGYSPDRSPLGLGGASNCLLVWITEEEVAVGPMFPFNVGYIARFWGLERRAPRLGTHATVQRGLFGRSVLLRFDQPGIGDFRLRLRDPEGFVRALAA